MIISLWVSLCLSLTMSTLMTCWPLVTTTPLDYTVATSVTSNSYPLKQGKAVMDTEDTMTMIMSLLTVIKMLLVIQGVERNPGPQFTYRMSLLEEPPTMDLSIVPVSLHCKDGQITGDMTILAHYSKMMCEVSNSQCKFCENIVHLPDISMVTVTHLLELLSTSVTDLQEEDGRKRVIQLQVALGCTGITDLRKIKHDPVPGQCPNCLMYIIFTIKIPQNMMDDCWWTNNQFNCSTQPQH